jgi:hypothetical protein
MLRKMLLVSPEYFDRIRQSREEENAEALEDGRLMRCLLKDKGNKGHPYDTWVKVRQVLDPLLRRARNKVRPVPLPLYEIPEQKTSVAETGVQTDGSDRAARADRATMKRKGLPAITWGLDKGRDR